MPVLHVSNFNTVLSLLGGWITLYGLVSHLCKHHLYLSEALISLLAGLGFSPRAANLIRPLEYAGNEKNVERITLDFSRLVLGVQLVIAGVELPKKYLKREWAPLLVLVGLVMSLMWLTTSLLVWALVPGLPFLHALAVGSCVTPTDPVLSNVILKGKFADYNVPKNLQHLIIAESGTNDGLGYPFLFFALYLIKYTGGVDDPGGDGAPMAIGLWMGETWGYTIALSVVYGATAGWLAKNLLRWADKRQFVDKESLLVFSIALALLVLGTCGMAGSDDILACFIAGNTFTWDDWFRLRTLEETLQPALDKLLNIAVFMWFGAVCPWEDFLQNSAIPVHRLILLGILVLVLRRMPWVLATHKLVPQIPDVRQALYVGFFGPIGVSAIFYLYILIEFVNSSLSEGGEVRDDVKSLSDGARVIVWFLAVCSIVVHGMTIPLGKLGHLLSGAMSSWQGTAVEELRNSGAVAVDLTSLPAPFSPIRRWLSGDMDGGERDPALRVPLLFRTSRSSGMTIEEEGGERRV
ncbi:related to Na+/H+-exchanging protein [Cephalotrichum gorgonifer]|uniref:Related to Na+/H+-exchanging protein n=1 Tax=Cephalotrichum gorgonifer TaxID=2041049 RepID=A0AAE8SWN0_9PEZI|nr:related to Na+/H+-exchanging protein [Cephalotrichum gorgonifer]